MATKQVLVTPTWLNQQIKQNHKNFKVLDAAFFLPMMKRDAKEEYKNEHIPSAVQFDQRDCYDNKSKYDLMMPTPEQFSKYVGNLGVSETTEVVLYDNLADLGLFSAQRAWWLFRAFGHNNVSILDGGLPRWKKEGFAVTSEIPKIVPVKYTPKPNAELVKGFENIVENLTKKEFQLVDARPPPRFNGTGKEPVEGIKPGHIPCSINVPFTKVLDPEKKVFKQPDEIKAVFKEHGVDLSKPIVASCGSGVSGCMLVLAAYLVGKEDVALYDGSWTEWYLRAKPEQMECVPKEDS